VPKDQVVADDCGDDDTFRPGSNSYRFELRADHPSGTHWYHAHKHGSTHDQVSGGLAGAIIIEDDPDADDPMPKYIADAPERVFILTSDGAIQVDPNLDGNGEGGEVPDPKITLTPGAVERWRIINADPSESAFVQLQVDSTDVELWQIAYDGLTLEKRVQITSDDNDLDPWTVTSPVVPWRPGTAPT